MSYQRFKCWWSALLTYLPLNELHHIYKPSFRLVITAAGQQADNLPASLKQRLFSTHTHHRDEQSKDPLPVIRVDLLVNGFHWADRLPESKHARWLIYMLLPLSALFYYCRLYFVSELPSNFNVVTSLFATFVVGAILAAGLSLNRRLLRFYVRFASSGEPLPCIPSSVIESRNEPIFICRRPRDDFSKESLTKLDRRLILRDIEWQWARGQSVLLRQAWVSRIGVDWRAKSDRYKLSQDDETWLWSLTRFSLRRLLVVAPRPNKNEAVDMLSMIDSALDQRAMKNEKKESSFLLPFKLHLTQLKVYLCLISAIFLFGIHTHYTQQEAKDGATKIELYSLTDASISLLGTSVPTNVRMTQQVPANRNKNSYVIDGTGIVYTSQAIDGTLKIPIDAFSEAVLLHGWPIVLGGLSVLWIVWFVCTRPMQLDHLKRWYDRTIGDPPDKGQMFLLRHDLPPAQQWEEIVEDDFRESIEEFGPSDEKVWHFAEGVLLVLLFEVIHLVH